LWSVNAAFVKSMNRNVLTRPKEFEVVAPAGRVNPVGGASPPENPTVSFRNGLLSNTDAEGSKKLSGPAFQTNSPPPIFTELERNAPMYIVAVGGSNGLPATPAS